MKRLCACVIALFIVFASFSQPVLAVMSGGNNNYWPGEVNQQRTAPFDYKFLAPSPEWMDWVSDQIPATFSDDKVHYELADTVLEVDSQVTDRLATAAQLLSGGTAPMLRPNKIVAEGGYIPKDVLDQAAQAKGRQIKNGTIVVDKATGTAFKVVSPTVFTGVFTADETLGEMVEPLKNSYSVARPQITEVLKDFELKEDTIRLTRGNISGFAPNIEQNLVLPGLATPQAFGDTLKDFKYLSDDPFIKLLFTNQILEASLGNGQKIQVSVSGGLGIEDIDLTGRYSGFDGYRIALTLKQESFLVVEMDTQVKSEVRIPILGLDIPFGIGRIGGGVFAIVGMDGTLSLEIEARDYTETTLGVRGGTKFYIPTSVKPIFGQTFTSDGEVDLNGDIDGYLKFGPMMGLELFGFDLVGAGVFLGAGVSVQAEGKMLDVHLYGLFNVYVKLAGEYFNLANYRPTILRRKQANTAGFRIKVLEAFVMPGRVGGMIEKEGSQPFSFEPVAGVSYRILVVPTGVPFDPNDKKAPNQPDIRKYPATGYAATNEEGEFFQDELMLYKNDQVYIEFLHNGEALFSNPVSPTLPFGNFTITAADYFNDYVTGQVDPIRVINWDAPAEAPAEEQYEWAYCTGGLVTVNTYHSHNYNIHEPTGEQARTITDAFGNFDTRIPIISIVTGLPILNTGFDVYENPENYGNMGGFDLALDYHEAVRTTRIPFKTTMSMSFSRTIEMVPGSVLSFEENGNIINRVQFDESIWIVNPTGTRTPTGDQFHYKRIVFSTQDYYQTEYDYSKAPDYVRNAQYKSGETGKILTPLLDSQGKETGAALFQERVTVEWVWQAHPNPVTITSDDHTTVNLQGGTFSVTANGFKPFKFTLKGAPTDVKIGSADGIMQIPANLAPGDYVFTIRAEELRQNKVLQFTQDDPSEGNAPSLPAEQSFTLTVSEEFETTQPSQPPTKTFPVKPFEPAQPAGPPGTVPAIEDADHNYRFVKLLGSSDYEIQIKASGSEPIGWTLEKRSDRYPVPKGVSIDAGSGLLTISDGIEPGTYYFLIKVDNDVGVDTQECSLEVVEPVRPTLPPESLPALPSEPTSPSVPTLPTEPSRTAPVIEDADHNYQFLMLLGGGDDEVQIRASGSEPLRWTLEKRSDRYLIPRGVSLNADSGLLKISDGIDPGTYYFIIQASNSVGSDTQECTLKVVEPLRPTLPRAISPTQPITKTTADLQGLATGGKMQLQQLPYVKSPNLDIDVPGQPDSQIPEVPPNSVTIRYNDPKDVYTEDRNAIDGTAFVHWHACPGVLVANETGAGIMIIDEAPRCENYHYIAPNTIPKNVRDALMQSIKEQAASLTKDDVFMGETFNRDSLIESINQLVTNPMGQGGYLEYGSLLKAIAAQKGGNFEVALSEDTGTFVTGKYFAALKENPKANLAISQPGATVKFTGAEVLADEDTAMMMYDFGFSASAPHQTEILTTANVDAQAGDSFVFSFGYHGALPGVGSFSIETGLVEGQKANVYRFETGDATAGGQASFTLVAGDVAVGAKGVVTYQNNTMSEYLVTTKHLEGAVVGEMAARQSVKKESNPFLLWCIVLAVMIAAGAGFAITKLHHAKKSAH